MAKPNTPTASNPQPQDPTDPELHSQMFEDPPEAGQDQDHDPDPSPDLEDAPRSRRRRVEKLCDDIGRLTVDELCEAATELVTTRNAVAALLHANLQLALQRAMAPGQLRKV